MQAEIRKGKDESKGGKDVWDRSKKNSKNDEPKSLEDLLESYLPKEELAEAKRMIFGNPCVKNLVPGEARTIAEKLGF